MKNIFIISNCRAHEWPSILYKDTSYNVPCTLHITTLLLTVAAKYVRTYRPGTLLSLSANSFYAAYIFVRSITLSSVFFTN